MNRRHTSSVDITEVETRFSSRIFSTGDATVAYREAGRDGAPMCVIVHGLTGTSYSMLPLADAYRQAGFRVFAIDLPGHGQSDMIAIESIDTISDWLEHVLRQLCGQAPFVLVGDSFGSSVCLAYAQKYGLDDASRLILGAPIPTMSRAMRWLDRLSSRLPDALARSIYYTNHALEPVRISYLLDQKDNLPLRQLVSQCIEVEGPLVNHQYAEGSLMGAYLAHSPFAQPLATSLARQTVVVYGEHDRLAGTAAHRRLQDWGAEAKIVVVPHCGHLVHLEAIGAMVDAASPA